MYRLSYILTLLGLFGLSIYHPQLWIRIALGFLLIANAIFLWR